MSLVQSIKRQRETRSFGDYADLFIGVVKSYLADSARVDVVFDRYLPNSIKHGTRIKRARGSKGIRRIIDGRNVKNPDNWATYISVPENKATLAKFLSEEMINTVTEGEIITSGGFEQQDHAMSNQNSDVSGLFATHEGPIHVSFYMGAMLCQRDFRDSLLSVKIQTCCSCCTPTLSFCRIKFG